MRLPEQVLGTARHALSTTAQGCRAGRGWVIAPRSRICGRTTQVAQAGPRPNWYPGMTTLTWWAGRPWRPTLGSWNGGRPAVGLGQIDRTAGGGQQQRSVAAPRQRRWR